MAEIIARFFIVLIALILFIGLMIYAIKVDREINVDEFQNTAVNVSFAVSSEAHSEEVYLVNGAIEEWMRGEYSASQLYDIYHSKIGRLDYPAPVQIRFHVEGIPSGVAVVTQTVDISEDADFTSVQTHYVAAHRDEINIYNLKTSQEYFYRVTVTASDGAVVTTEGSFVTAASPRLIYVDGIRNVRDIGGYKTADGRELKQGMFYRGTELRGTENPDLCLTSRGEATMTDELGIKYELDLRGEGEGSEPLGEGINRKYYAFYYNYSNVFTDNGRECIREIFADLANAENYPLYMHCTGGSDRTGTAVYLLMALLGMSEEDCYREWELSAFYNGGSHEEDMAAFVSAFDGVWGETLQQKTENYLYLCGVTSEQIEAIKTILLK